MIGILMVALGAMLDEVAVSFGKKEMQLKHESIFTFGFLALFWSLIFFGAMIIWKGSFDFQLASLPTFSLRVLFELAIYYFIVKGIKEASRTTSSFIRVISVPLLLIVDMIIGYSPSFYQILGILLIVGSVLILSMNHGIEKKGLGYVIANALLAVITISLYKYNIENFNAVEAEQFVMILILMIAIFTADMLIKKENPFLFFKNQLYIIQSVSFGIGGVLLSFAFMFAPASVITAGKRSSELVFSLASGSVIFHEKNIALKLGGLIFSVIGLILLTIG